MTTGSMVGNNTTVSLDCEISENHFFSLGFGHSFFRFDKFSKTIITIITITVFKTENTYQISLDKKRCWTVELVYMYSYICYISFIPENPRSCIQLQIYSALKGEPWLSSNKACILLLFIIIKVFKCRFNSKSSM